MGKFLNLSGLSFLNQKNRNNNTEFIELNIKELTVRFLNLTPGPQEHLLMAATVTATGEKATTVTACLIEHRALTWVTLMI